MTFAPGKSGNPGGRKKDKPWANALRIALAEEGPEGKKKLRMVAEMVVERAIAGDIQAAKEIGDRMDGKPFTQTEEDDVNLAEVLTKIAVVLGRSDTGSGT